MDTTRASLLLRVRDPADQEAWSTFDAIYRPLLTKFCRSARLQDADAEDLVQSCMFSIHEHIRDFRYDPQKGRFKGWLRTMVNNRIRNARAKLAAQQVESAVFQGLQDPEPLPEETFEKFWMQEHMVHALRQIRREVEETTFAAYELYAMRGNTADEVCRALGLTQNQLHGMKFRITLRLRERLAELLGDAPT